MATAAKNEIGIDDIISRIRAEAENIAARAKGAHLDSQTKAHRAKRSLHNVWIPRVSAQPAFELKQSYHVRDFLLFHDRDFVSNAYRGILQREADEAGLQNYLRKLRSGVSKIEILGLLRFSPEGRAARTTIRGLLLARFLAARVYRVPVIGYFLRWAVGLVLLPRLIENTVRYQHHTMALHAQLDDNLTGFARRVEQAISFAVEELDQRKADRTAVEELDQRKADRTVLEELDQRKADREFSLAEADRLDSVRISMEVLELATKQLERCLSGTDSQVARALEELTTLRETMGKAGRATQEAIEKAVVATQVLQASVKRLDHDFAESGVKTVSRDLSQQDRKLNILMDEVRLRLPKPLSQKQLSRIAEESRHRFDGLYLRLENRFRGDPKGIKERAKIYLPIVKEVGAGSKDRPILDIACGRGEWLELLSEESLVGRGVDVNREMVKLCKERNLDAIENDAISFIRSLPDNSIGAVTVFHMIEHLVFEELVNLLDEIVRVLQPAGAAIFETPNPSNVLVGSNTFYLDPTHRNPLPAPLVKFLAESRGFSEVKVMQLHPYPLSEQVVDRGDGEVIARFNALFYGPQDYALIARKR